MPYRAGKDLLLEQTIQWKDKKVIPLDSSNRTSGPALQFFALASHSTRLARHIIAITMHRRWKLGLDVREYECGLVGDAGDLAHKSQCVVLIGDHHIDLVFQLRIWHAFPILFQILVYGWIDFPHGGKKHGCGFAHFASRLLRRPS